MSNRKKDTYESLFRYVNDNLGITGGLQCKLFMADYEMAMTDGFQLVVPTAKITHCHFHFSQACKRNAKKCTPMQIFFDAYVSFGSLFFKTNIFFNGAKVFYCVQICFNTFKSKIVAIKICYLILLFLYRNGSLAKRFYYKLLSLPLLPAHTIRMTFEKLKLQAEVYQDMHGHPNAFDRFFNYYYNQWISGTRHVSNPFAML